MANYCSSGGHALRTECSNCAAFAEHKSVRRQPTSSAVEGIASTYLFAHLGRQPSYRVRTRQCSSCGREFDTLELSRLVFDAAIQKLTQSQSELYRVENELAQLKRTLRGVLAAQESCSKEVLSGVASLRKLIDGHQVSDRSSSER